MSTAVESAAVVAATVEAAAAVEAITPAATEAKPNHGPTQIGGAVTTVVAVVVGAERVTEPAVRISLRRSYSDEHPSRDGGTLDPASLRCIAFEI